MRPDSPIASEMQLGLGYRSGDLELREAPPVAVIIHTTGAGIPARFLREGQRRGDRTPFDTANRVYTRIMRSSAHYVVGQVGECTQTVPEDHVAWHVGSGKSAPYFRSSWVPRWRRAEYEWWRSRWRGLTSPRDLAGGDLYRATPGSSSRLYRRGAVNPNTIGIEVVPPLDDVRGEWSADAWRTLVALVLDICARHGIPVERTHIITHSDAHPLARTRRGVGWDVGPGQWSWQRFARACEANL